MGCLSCIPPPASQLSRKVYNILVPDIFPLVAPSVEEAIPPATTRKIAKLEEYVQRNPHKIPKVSRRLARRIRAAADSDSTHGFAKLAVHAYIYLLARSTGEEAAYTANYFATELIGPSQPVVSGPARPMPPRDPPLPGAAPGRRARSPSAAAA
jgi:hypothetical protein